MKNIKGLILKDLLNLNHYKTTLIASIIIFSLIAVSQKDFSSFLPGMLIMMVGMIALSTFSYDEIGKTDKFMLALPTSRKDIVKAKYVLIVGLTLIGAIVAFFLNLVISLLVFKQAPNIMDNIFVIVGALFGIGLIQCVQIPSIYKWGFEKGRIQMFLVFALLVVLGGIGIFITQRINLNIDINTLETMLAIFGVPLLIILNIVMYFISYRISNKIYSKKEI